MDFQQAFEDNAIFNRFLQRPSKQLIAIALTGLCIYLATRLALSLQFNEKFVAPIWPTAGLAIAAAMLFGQRAFAGIFLGVFFAALSELYLVSGSDSLIAYVFSGFAPIIASALLAIGTALEIFLVFVFLNSRHQQSYRLNKVSDVCLFVCLVISASALNATFGLFTFSLFHIAAVDFSSLWFSWWAGDATGILIALPVIMLFSHYNPYKMIRENLLIHLSALVLLVLFSAITFFEWLSLDFFVIQSYLFIPLLMWINYQCGRTVTLAVILIVLASIYGTLLGYGPFAHTNEQLSMFLLQGFIVFLAITELIQDAILKEREDALTDLSISNNNLVRTSRLHKQAQKMAEEKARQAEQAAQLKGEFLATMSHEIRTPMNGVIGMIDLILETNLDEEQHEYMDTVKYSAESLLIVINDILDYSKVESGKLELDNSPFNLSKLIQTCLNTFQSETREKNIKLIFDQQGSDDWVKGDASRLRQVLTNLISNAIKFTAEGHVRVSYQCLHDADDELTYQIAVSDTGIGIKDSARDAIFESFHQADSSHTRRYGGTGLGLAIVRKLVHIMGGEIWVDSHENKGSTFTFTVKLNHSEPVAKSHQGIHIPAYEEVDEQEISNLHVLLVEDNLTNKVVAHKMLLKLGCQVDYAENGIEAVKQAKASRYDFILMDCQMPEMDGFEATEIIRRWQCDNHLPATPIFALTANAMAGDREKCLDAGMNDYISKPILLSDLEKVILKWLPTFTENLDLQHGIAQQCSK